MPLGATGTLRQIEIRLRFVMTTLHEMNFGMRELVAKLNRVLISSIQL